MNSSKKQKFVALFFKFLGTFLGMNKGSADGNPQPLIEYFQKNHQIMQFDTENHMKKLLTCGILHYMIDVKELAYEILVHFRYLCIFTNTLQGYKLKGTQQEKLF